MQLTRTKQWREARGLTQRGLAAEAGISEVTVARLETGHSSTPSTARKVADALGISPADLLERPPVPLGEASPARPADTIKSSDPLGGWISRALSEGEFAREFERAKGSQELADQLRRAKDAEVTERDQAVATLRKRSAPPDEILEAQRDRVVSSAQFTAAMFLATELWRGHDVSGTDPRTIVADVVHNQEDLFTGGPTAQEPRETA
jgi:transcriptional regulator with XRE-family HTH domain